MAAAFYCEEAKKTSKNMILREKKIKALVAKSMAVLSGLVVIGTIHTASAESTADALKAFGLIGTWSDDCSKDVFQQGGWRITYSQPYFGSAKIETIFRTKTGIGPTALSEINSAERVSDEKLKYSSTQISKKLSINAADPGKDQPVSTVEIETVIQRVGPHIRIFSSHSADHKTTFVEDGQQILEAQGGGQIRTPLPLLERCR